MEEEIPLQVIIYRLYEPARFADSSYIRTEFDEKTLPKYTMRITFQQDGRAHMVDFCSIYARNPFTARTHVLSNPSSQVLVKGNVLTVLKDQLCRVGRRFDELTILDVVQRPRRVPGMAEAVHRETIETPLSVERCKHRLGIRESELPFTNIPTLQKMLFDVLEGILISVAIQSAHMFASMAVSAFPPPCPSSQGNVLYIENSSSRLHRTSGLFLRK